MFVSLAFGQSPFVASPSWTRLTGVQTVGFERGRRTEFEQTGTGTATVTLVDLTGALDPTVTSGLDPMTQVKIELQNPVTSSIETVYRGFLSRLSYEMYPTETVTTVTLEAVDAFALLAAMEMTPGNQGHTAPWEVSTDVFFNGMGGTTGRGIVDNVLPKDRIVKVLDDLGWPGTGLGISVANLRNIFSGNVAMQEAVYARRDQALSVIFDAADAEFPGGVANFFVAKDGVITFHGRFARFDPNNYGTYGIVSWSAGDLSAVAADTTRAVITGLQWDRGEEFIINSALALPQGIDGAQIPTATIDDTGSQADFGIRSRSWENLLVYKGEEQSGRLPMLDETALYAQYFVDNYAQPRNRVNQIQLKSQDPSLAYGPALWAFLCGVDLGHVVALKTTHPGGGGFNESFFVEGIRFNAQALNNRFPIIDMELDLSPQAYYTQQPFTPNNAAPQPTVSRSPSISPLFRGP